METMGKRIRQLRERAGLTQEALAERMGVSPQAVSKWENDQSCPDITTLPQLAEILGVSCDTLLGKSPMPENTGSVKDDKDDSGKVLNVSLRFGKIVFPIAVLVFGAELLANHLMNLQISWWTLLWTNAVTFLGISMLISDVSAFAIGVTVVGLYFAVQAFFPQIYISLQWPLIVAALFILWGIGMLIDTLGGKKKRRKYEFQHNQKERFEQSVEGGYVTAECSFCERRAYANTPVLNGGDVSLNFGNLTVDLTDCTTVATGASLNLNAAFGKLTVILPRSVRAEISDSASFGKVNFATPSAEASQVLHLNCNVSFGSIEIEYA